MKPSWHQEARAAGVWEVRRDARGAMIFVDTPAGWLL